MFTFLSVIIPVMHQGSNLQLESCTHAVMRDRERPSRGVGWVLAPIISFASYLLYVLALKMALDADRA